jgi:hypothetical protein
MRSWCRVPSPMLASGRRGAGGPLPDIGHSAAIEASSPTAATAAVTGPGCHCGRRQARQAQPAALCWRGGPAHGCRGRCRNCQPFSRRRDHCRPACGARNDDGPTVRLPTLGRALGLPLGGAVTQPGVAAHDHVAGQTHRAARRASSRRHLSLATPGTALARTATHRKLWSAAPARRIR